MNRSAGSAAGVGDRHRLVRPALAPAIAPTPTKPEEPAPPAAERRGGGGGDGPTVVHSAIIGLLRELPPPGSPWNTAKRDQFLVTFDNLIKLLYQAEEKSP